MVSAEILVRLFGLLIGATVVATAFRFETNRRVAISRTLLGSAINSDNSIWWEGGLKFGCTACGRCCQNDGEVWLDTDEFVDLASHLKISNEQVLDLYTERIMSGWVKLKNKISSDPKEADRCIFLDDDGKKCTVYEARPVQCRTYPWWPRLLSNSSMFESEAVVPDDVPLAVGVRHWSAKEGGCEGINHADASIIGKTTIHRNHELYKMYNDVFPFIASGDDKNRLLSKAGVIAAVIKSTMAWVEDFVLKYKLCPFAEKVFTQRTTRYRVFLGSEKEKIIERIKYEMLALLTSKEEDVATTLLMLPFAYQDFESWYDLSVEIEDEIMPLIEKESRGPQPPKVKSLPKRKTLLQKASEAKAKQSVKNEEEGSSKCPVHSTGTTKENSGEPLPEIQLAFFHPSFQWADAETFDDPLNFEKRAPFPTINLLRAARVREYADEKKTQKIADANVSALEEAGSQNLVKQFEGFLRLALEAD